MHDKFFQTSKQDYYNIFEIILKNTIHKFNIFYKIIPSYVLKKENGIKFVKLLRKMIKVLFVCLGNICRSPMAEFVFKDYVRKQGKEDEFLDFMINYKKAEMDKKEIKSISYLFKNCEKMNEPYIEEETNIESKEENKAE